MLLTLFGPPASGKSTLGDHLVVAHNFIHLPLGRLLKDRSFLNEVGIEEAVVTEAVRNGVTLSSERLFDWLDRQIENADRSVVVDGYPREPQALPRFNDLVSRLSPRQNVFAAHLQGTLAETQLRTEHRKRADDSQEQVATRYHEYLTRQLPLLAKLHPSVVTCDLKMTAPTAEIAEYLVSCKPGIRLRGPK